MVCGDIWFSEFNEEVKCFGGGRGREGEGGCVWLETKLVFLEGIPGRVTGFMVLSESGMG